MLVLKDSRLIRISPKGVKLRNGMLKHVLSMSFATLFCRITGLGRVWIMAFVLGTSATASAYNIANGLPNILYDLIAGGILGTAFLPVYMEEKKKGEGSANSYISNMICILVMILGICSLIALSFAPQIVGTQTFTVDQSSNDVASLSVSLFRMFAFQLLFYGLGGIFTAVLNANRVYGIPALAPAANNIIVILAFIGYSVTVASSQDLALIILGIGTTLGVFIQFSVQIPLIAKTGFRFKVIIDFKSLAFKETLKIALPTLLYIVGVLAATSFRNAFSLSVGNEVPSVLTYAWTWFQLPYGILAVSLSTTMFTEMGQSAAERDWEGLRHQFLTGIKMTSLIMVPLSVVMIFISPDVMQLFKFGAFTEESALACASVLSIWCLGLPAYAGTMFLYKVFASMKKFGKFAVLSTSLCVLQIIGYIVLGQQFGVMGFPMSDVLYYTIMFIGSYFLLKKETNMKERTGLFSFFLKLSISATVGFVAMVLVSFAVPVDDSLLISIVKIAVLGLTGVTSFFIMSKVLKIPETQNIIEKLKKS